MLKVGDIVPHFSLDDQHGKPLTTDELLESGWLLLYFYPADFTPLCTAQACMARDHYGELTEARVRLAGVSRQSADSKRRFAEQLHLPFTLLADTQGTVQKSFGVLALGGLVTRRVTFLITRDDQGRPIVADRYESNFTVRGHTRFVERVLQRVRATQLVTRADS